MRPKPKTWMEYWDSLPGPFRWAISLVVMGVAVAVVILTNFGVTSLYHAKANIQLSGPFKAFSIGVP